jgi:hypothetical protein
MVYNVIRLLSPISSLDPVWSSAPVPNRPPGYQAAGP